MFRWLIWYPPPLRAADVLRVGADLVQPGGEEDERPSSGCQVPGEMAVDLVCGLHALRVTRDGVAVEPEQAEDRNGRRHLVERAHPGEVVPALLGYDVGQFVVGKVAHLGPVAGVDDLLGPPRGLGVLPQPLQHVHPRWAKQHSSHSFSLRSRCRMAVWQSRNPRVVCRH